MKCKYCSFRSSVRSFMIDHIKSNHRNRVMSSSSSFNTDQSEDYILTSLIESSFSSMVEPTYSGGGGSSGSYDSGSSDSGSCGD
jgi:hypothetical protein